MPPAEGDMPPLPTPIDLDDVKTMDITNHNNCDMFINGHFILNKKKGKGILLSTKGSFKDCLHLLGSYDAVSH